VPYVNYIDELRQVIRNLHNAESRHVESVSVKEIFQGTTVWEGVVEVFELIGHPTASRIYAWAHEVTGGKKRHVTVLHGGPVDSPQAAVRAAIVRDYKLDEEA
jgi:hypothetical protein